MDKSAIRFHSQIKTRLQSLHLNVDNFADNVALIQNNIKNYAHGISKWVYLTSYFMPNPPESILVNILNMERAMTNMLLPTSPLIHIGLTETHHIIRYFLDKGYPRSTLFVMQSVPPWDALHDLLWPIYWHYIITIVPIIIKIVLFAIIEDAYRECMLYIAINAYKLCKLEIVWPFNYGQRWLVSEQRTQIPRYDRIPVNSYGYWSPQNYTEIYCICHLRITPLAQLINLQ